jgi:hypothetical protein
MTDNDVNGVAGICAGDTIFFRRQKHEIFEISLIGFDKNNPN